MVAALGWIRWLLLSPLGRYLGGALSILLLLAWFYSWAEEKGRVQCEQRVEREAIELRERLDTEHNREIEKAHERAREAQRQSRELEDKINEIIKSAQESEGADDVCVPDDIAERLRQL